MFRIKREYENVFIYISISVCMCVFSRSSKTLYGTPEEEGVDGNSEFWYSKTLELGLNLDKK